MDIKFNKDTLSHLTCDTIALEAKADLMSRPINNTETLVLVVDMVNGFAKKGALSSPRIGSLIPKITSALDLLDEAVFVFVRDEHCDSSIEMKWFPPHCHTEKEARLVSELRDYKHIDIPKNSTNAFFNLKEKIDLASFKRILIMGCCTDICILQLALTLRAYLNENNSPVPVTVFTEYVETYDSNIHSADLYNLFALKNMEGAGVEIFKRLV